MSTVASSVGKFVWHEQVSSDPKQAQDFYTQLFGWGTEMFKPGEVDYTMISSRGQTHGGFSKALEGAPPPHWLSHILVESVQETIEKATRAGGTLAAGPFEMSEVGEMAIVRDPQGAFVGIFEPEGEMPAPEGVFVWDELGTSDVDAAQRFYEDVFGWTTSDMGPDYGGYRIFNRGETGIAGLICPFRTRRCRRTGSPTSSSAIPTRSSPRRRNSAAPPSQSRWTCRKSDELPSSRTRRARASGSSGPIPRRRLEHTAARAPRAAYPSPYSSCRRNQTPRSLRPFGARSSHMYIAQSASRPRA